MDSLLAEVLTSLPKTVLLTLFTGFAIVIPVAAGFFLVRKLIACTGGIINKLGDGVANKVAAQSQARMAGTIVPCPSCNAFEHGHTTKS